MTSGDFSVLEAGILDEFHKLYGNEGFPERSSIRMVARENTGAGRYVRLHCGQAVDGPDRMLDLKGGFIQMEGVPDGLMAVVTIQGGQVRELEIATYGDTTWDGDEGPWSIVGAAAT